MLYIRKKEDLVKYLEIKRLEFKNIGFVPTMGALHRGHLSLIARSKSETDITVCSIFVNPTQFNNSIDFLKYPLTLEKDLQLLENSGTDVLFHPSVSELYPDGTANLEHYQLGNLENILEGKYRPGHFQGVCQVMRRLLHCVQPQRLFMGEKDYQQCLVVDHLLKLMNSETVLVKSETIREPEGLAMSSRNLRLSEEDKKTALVIPAVLQYVKNHLNAGPIEELRQKALRMMEEKGLKADYLELATRDQFEIIREWDGMEPIVILAAAYIKEVRLIDNLIFDPGSPDR